MKICAEEADRLHAEGRWTDGQTWWSKRSLFANFLSFLYRAEY